MVLSERAGIDCKLPRRKYSITEAGEDYLEFWAISLAGTGKIWTCSSKSTMGIEREARGLEKGSAGSSSNIRARR